MTKRKTAILIAAPALLIVTVAVVVPMVVLGFQSLNAYGTSSLSIDGLGFDNYVRIITTPFYQTSIVRTLSLAAIVVIVVAPMGFILAVEFIRSRGARKAALSLLILSPLLISVIIRNLGWIIILGPQSVVANVMTWLGVSGAVSGLLNTPAAIVIGLAHVMVPFMMLPIVAALENMDSNTVAAARTLGASPMAVLRDIVIPAARPGLVAGGTLVFVLSASYFITPALLGGARIPMMSFLIYQAVSGSANFSFAAAASVVLLVMTTIVSYAVTSLNRSSVNDVKAR